MRSAVTALLLAGSAVWSAAAPGTAAADDAMPDPPSVLFQDLFVAVQLAPVFADGKVFPDAVPKAAPSQILREYQGAHPDSPQALATFVESHFALPAPATAVPAATGQAHLLQHIDTLWQQLTRSTPVVPPYGSLLALPRPFVVPGGRFREMYYWDSYFTMLGLRESGRRDLMTDMLADFAYLIDTYGHVPNGARTYYLSRSQPPLFFEMVRLLSPEDPARAFARYLPQLKREYAFWMQGEATLLPGTAHRRVVCLPDGTKLNRYWDDRDAPRDESYREDRELAGTSPRPAAQLYRDIRAAAESGWDFSSRWFADGRQRGTIETTALLPVDLNSLLFGLETAIRRGCRAVRQERCAAEFTARAEARHAAMDRHLWDAASGAYADYRWTAGVRSRRLSAATLYPLFEGLASAAQGAAVAATVSRHLLKAGGLVTTPVATGEQWDAPNGWAPLQWIGVAAARRYGHGTLARQIACRWMTNVATVFRQTGKLEEKYDVIDTGRRGGGGEYPTQDGFGWTNGVMRKLAALYPAYLTETRPGQCVGG
jgi:alpha,alpha-trehalase